MKTNNKKLQEQKKYEIIHRIEQFETFLNDLKGVFDHCIIVLPEREFTIGEERARAEAHERKLKEGSI